MAGITKGPWHCAPQPGLQRAGVYAGANEDAVICDMTDEDVGREEFEANCRGVSAVPDLLEAAKVALDYIERCVEPSCDEGDELEDGTIHDGSTREGNLLRAAIAKATGQPIKVREV